MSLEESWAVLPKPGADKVILLYISITLHGSLRPIKSESYRHVEIFHLLIPGRNPSSYSKSYYIPPVYVYHRETGSIRKGSLFLPNINAHQQAPSQIKLLPKQVQLSEYSSICLHGTPIPDDTAATALVREGRGEPKAPPN